VFVDLSDAGGFAESVELLQVLIDAVDSAQHVAESALMVRHGTKKKIYASRKKKKKNKTIFLLDELE
jgi:hypothetical protein